MTFYEAALEILRREGRPLSVDEITQRALEENLLSHTGRVPEEIMRSRLVAMSQVEQGREVVAVAPGTFGLAEWGLEQDDAAAQASLPAPPDLGPPLRPTERTPMTLQEARSARAAIEQGKHEAADREARAKARRRWRRPTPGETPADALEAIVVEVGGGPVDLIYVVQALDRQEDLPEGFPTDIDGLRRLAMDENAARAEAGLPPRFVVQGDRIDLTQPPGATGTPAFDPDAVHFGRDDRALSRAADRLAKGLADLDAEAIERLLLRLLDAYGVEGVKVAKRSAKGSPLFLGTLRVGVVKLRLAIRLVASGRDLCPDDVDELREDLEHYSAGVGVLASTGRAERSVRSRAEDASKKPVLLFDGAALARACVERGLGVRRRLEETVEYDERALVWAAQGGQ
ncbi:MAG: hypothetical protein D6729_12385 [Deltaproteobacteria bacterium]|nr:MAG: hypothetical protein D6729_12385 [Deltaproteobacteria bacterium]